MLHPRRSTGDGAPTHKGVDPQAPSGSLERGSQGRLRGQSCGRCIFLLNPFLNVPPQCFSALAQASPSAQVETSGEGLLPQRAGHPLSPRGHPARHPHAALQQPGPIPPVSSAALWGRIYHMEIISLLFLKSVNQPHNHFLKNIPAIK